VRLRSARLQHCVGSVNALNIRIATPLRPD